MRLNKKLAVIAVSAVAAIAVAGGSAWAYIAIHGSGSGTATTTASTDSVSLSASASISDVDTPSAITVTATTTGKQRHISSVTVTLGTLPAGCQASWISLSNGGPGTTSGTVTTAGTWSGQTLATPGSYDLTGTSLSVSIVNDPDHDQSACLNGPIGLTLTSS